MSKYYEKGKVKIHIQVSLDDEIVESVDVDERVVSVVLETRKLMGQMSTEEQSPISVLVADMLDDVCDLWLEDQVERYEGKEN